MYNRFKIFTPLTLALLSVLMVCCNTNGNASNNKINMNGSIQSFEITFRVMPNLPCHGSAYIITDKNFTISFDENKRSVDSSGNRKFDCIQKKVFQKDLAKTDQLMQLSSIDLDDWEAAPDESCEGGVSHSIIFKKEGKIKEIHYGGCTKNFDENTKMIVNYINSQIPEKYKINL